MRSKLRPDWYSLITGEYVDLDQSGIYEWQITGIGLYVGKAKRLCSRIRAYPNNVRRMIDGLAWHGNPQKDYRQIHYELRNAYDNGIAVRVIILETCDPAARAERERHWIERRRREQMVGGPRVLNSN